MVVERGALLLLFEALAPGVAERPRRGVVVAAGDRPLEELLPAMVAFACNVEELSESTHLPESEGGRVSTSNNKPDWRMIPLFKMILVNTSTAPPSTKCRPF